VLITTFQHFGWQKLQCPQKSEDLSRYLQIPDEELNAVEEETGAHFFLLSNDEHPGRLAWDRIMKVWFRSFSFLNG